MSSPVRVLHMANALGLGGTEKVMQLFVAHLDRDKFLPAVFCPQDGERAAQIRKLGIKTYIAGDLLTDLLHFEPQIVHIHRAGWTEPGQLKPLRLAGIKAVVETNVFGRHDPDPEASIINRTLFVSQFCLNRFSQTTSIDTTRPRYDYIYNPVDTDFFDKASIHERDYSLPVVGRMSRPDPGKWSQFALEFLPHIVKRIPNFRYNIIGGIPEAEAFVKNHDLQENVRFLPQVNTDQEIVEFMNGISLLAHANDTGESFGLTIAEAMACGLPVVTHPSEGLRDNAQLELVENGITGLIATSTEEYANAVAFLLSNPSDARRMGLAGKAKAHRLFRVQTITQKLEIIYRQLLMQKGIIQ